MTTMILPRAVPRAESTFDRFLLAASAALVAMVEHRHDRARLMRFEAAVQARRDGAAFRHVGLLPR